MWIHEYACVQRNIVTRMYAVTCDTHTHAGVGRDSEVSIATRYGLDGPGLKSRWGEEIFRTRPDRPWGPPSLLYNRYRISFPGVKRQERAVNHDPHLAPRAKKD
jgi:hypothetical protein